MVGINGLSPEVRCNEVVNGLPLLFGDLNFSGTTASALVDTDRV
jgi:hypothetical protein